MLILWYFVMCYEFMFSILINFRFVLYDDFKTVLALITWLHCGVVDRGIMRILKFSDDDSWWSLGQTLWCTCTVFCDWHYQKQQLNILFLDTVVSNFDIKWQWVWNIQTFQITAQTGKIGSYNHLVISMWTSLTILL